METVIYEIHGHRVPKYMYDTPTTFRERVAARFNTIPSWVYITTEPYKDTRILTNEMDEKHFGPELIDRSKFEIDGNDFLLFWLNGKMRKTSMSRQILKAQFTADLKEIKNARDIEDILDILFDRAKNDRFVESIRKKIEINKNKVKTLENVFNTLSSYKPDYLPAFQKRESLITLTINHMFESIDTFFAHLTCSLYVPVSLCESIYKQYE